MSKHGTLTFYRRVEWPLLADRGLAAHLRCYVGTTGSLGLAGIRTLELGQALLDVTRVFADNEQSATYVITDITQALALALEGELHQSRFERELIFVHSF